MGKQISDGVGGALSDAAVCSLALLPPSASAPRLPFRQAPPEMSAAAGAALAGGAGAAPAGGAAGGAGGALAAIVAGLGANDDASANRLTALHQQQANLAAQRRATQKLIKNETAKKKRILEKARRLTNEELLEVMVSRGAAKAKAKAKAAAKAAAVAPAAAAPAAAAAVPADE